jgi:hypothetical protein
MAGSGIRFGLVSGSLGGGLMVYLAGPQVLQWSVLVKLVCGAAMRMFGTLLFGLQARWRERAWKAGRHEEACPPPC